MSFAAEVLRGRGRADLNEFASDVCETLYVACYGVTSGVPDVSVFGVGAASAVFYDFALSSE